MLNVLILIGATGYLIAAIVAFAVMRRRPELSERIWKADIAVSLVLVALAVADRDWFLTPLWVLNTALAAWNLHLTRRSADDDTDEATA